MRRFKAVARHEYLTNVRRKEFILITLGFPVFMLAIGAVSAAGTMMAASSLMSGKTLRVGMVDMSGALRLDRLPREGSVSVTAVPNPTTAKAKLKAGEFATLVVVEKEYLETGAVTLYKMKSGILQAEDRTPVGRLLTQALVDADKLGREVAKRLVAPTGDGARILVLNPKTGAFEPQNGAALIAKFAVPYTFTLLLTTSIFIAGNYLLRGLSEEKENRVIEVILSSISADDLLLGKLIGLAGVGLTQVGIWVLMGAVPSMLMWSSVVKVSMMGVVGAVLFFGLGFGLYAAMMAGIGSLGTSYRESQQISGIVSMLAVAPLMMIPVLIEYPNGTAARVLSFIPFTAPGTMVLRLTAAEVPMLDVALSAVLLTFTIWGTVRLSARLFRFGMLITGKRPGMKETFAALRRA